jgi:Na+/H+ antiporter NhaD/arsenite permease-like protein
MVAVIAVLLAARQPAIGLGAIAAALLISRARPPRQLLERIDWPLLLLFVGLFIVTASISATGLPGALLARAAAHGLDPARPLPLGGLCLLGANTIGNVPLVALLLAVWHPHDPAALPPLALLSTLAGNLLLTGSVANLIVFERAAATGVKLHFVEHARVGVPITLASFAWAYAWMWLVGTR